MVSDNTNTKFRRYLGVMLEFSESAKMSLCCTTHQHLSQTLSSLMRVCVYVCMRKIPITQLRRLRLQSSIDTTTNNKSNFVSRFRTFDRIDTYDRSIVAAFRTLEIAHRINFAWKLKNEKICVKKSKNECRQIYNEKKRWKTEKADRSAISDNYNKKF